MKRILSIILAALMLIGMLGGCAKPPASVEPSAKTDTTEPAEPTTDVAAPGEAEETRDVIEVVMPTYRSGEDAGAKFFLPQVERFNEKYKGVYHITIEESPSNTHTDRIKQLALQDQLPAIFQCSDSKWVEDYLIANDKLEDLSGFIDSNPEMKALFIQDSVDFCTKSNGKVVALPLTVLKPTGLYYNSSMFDLGGKKITELNWDEFAETLGDTKVAFQTAEGGWTTSLLLAAMIAGNGGADLLRAGVNEKITNFEDPIFVESFAQLQKLYQSNGWEGAVGAVYADAASAFYAKQSSVLPDGTWIIDKVNDPTDWANGFDGADVVGDYYPNNVAIANPCVYDWMMPAGLPEDQKEAGLAFFAFICSPEEVEAYILGEGGTAPNLEYSDSFREALAGSKLLSDFASSTNSETTYVPYWSDAINASLFTGEFSNLLPQLLKGSMTPEEFAAELSAAAVALD